jgi:hypothetical protein
LFAVFPFKLRRYISETPANFAPSVRSIFLLSPQFYRDVAVFNVRSSKASREKRSRRKIKPITTVKSIGRATQKRGALAERAAIFHAERERVLDVYFTLSAIFFEGGARVDSIF